MRNDNLVILVLAVTVMLWPSAVALGQSAVDTTSDWTPRHLADGQPDIQGTWNNVGAAHIPLELPDELRGGDVTAEDVQDYVQRRSDTRKADQWDGFDNSQGVGAYANYWFDWYWSEPDVADAPALVIDPPTGKLPAMTAAGKASVEFHREHLHDSYTTMESGDRCVSRGTYGIMMPTAYNNGKMFFQSPGYVVILSEMIHNARIIPIDAGSHANEKVRLWNGDPRGHWEGNTLVVESTNFRAVENQRAPGSRAPQTLARRVVERFTLVDPQTLRYELRVDDAATYTEPWTVAFNFKQDESYQQYEYACHEGNYAVPNSLSGARAEER